MRHVSTWEPAPRPADWVPDADTPPLVTRCRCNRTHLTNLYLDSGESERLTPDAWLQKHYNWKHHKALRGFSRRLHDDLAYLVSVGRVQARIDIHDPNRGTLYRRTR